MHLVVLEGASPCHVWVIDTCSNSKSVGFTVQISLSFVFYFFSYIAEHSWLTWRIYPEFGHAYTTFYQRTSLFYDQGLFKIQVTNMRKITTRIYERLQLNSIFKAQVGNKNPYNSKILYSTLNLSFKQGIKLAFQLGRIGGGY